ncbi:hypothetical protein CHS0354_002453 [Potamilus streckersoni]|uniref:tRNA-5-taurinomethyluridine 2-sulfurtransferase n=1 Tax=Potamilus streckersoni TaxID=2493646 RepID=A0AAE0W8X9_9BIVA|nr:hypothetical protein CHS0354_002453 [Potamilus streckersoni]
MMLSEMIRNIKTIVCGVSGGVDSAVAALLLKRKGYNVIGLFMKNWDVTNERGVCTTDQDREDAKFVCDHLKIPFYEVNFVKEYWNHVFSSFVKDYQAGLTPNPDVLCNKYIKFHAFFQYARNRFDAHAIATGHYARTDVGEDLYKIDPKKGEITKDVVKKIAASAGMEKIAKKKESMGICFIGSREYHKFIEEYVEPKPGRFIHLETGEVIGTHKGIHYWTLGQRAQIGGKSEALFIADKNTETQDITVVYGTDHPALFSQTMVTEPAHWINQPPQELLQDRKCDMDFRFQHIQKLIKCTVTLSDANCLTVSLQYPLRAITGGQYAVFYKGDECLGSAKILRPGPSLYMMNQKERVREPDIYYF